MRKPTSYNLSDESRRVLFLLAAGRQMSKSAALDAIILEEARRKRIPIREASARELPAAGKEESR